MKCHNQGPMQPKAYSLIILKFTYMSKIITTIEICNVSITPRRFPMALCNQLFLHPQLPGDHDPPID